EFLLFFHQIVTCILLSLKLYEPRKDPSTSDEVYGFLNIVEKPYIQILALPF
ncbi:8691_t:CDS:1, partial [Dentiscutata erythropus]